jgi:hypothetical protein
MQTTTSGHSDGDENADVQMHGSSISGLIMQGKYERPSQLW